MSEIVRKRLVDVCPVYPIKNANLDELETDCHIAFEIIGYHPNNFTKSIDKVLKEGSSDEILLSDFVYRVWKID